MAGHEINFFWQGAIWLLNFKVVAKARKLGAIKKKIVEKMHYTVMSNRRVFLALK